MYTLSVDLDVHFKKLNRSPWAPVYFLALLEDLGQDSMPTGQSRWDGAGVKE